MGLVQPQLSLDLRPSFIPKTISNFLKEVSPIGNVPDKVTKLDSFMKRLEEEMKKIDAFKRELPLCMILLNDAIVALKEELMQCKGRNVEPVLEEFIPLKINKENINHREEDDDSNTEYKDKKDWMSSVQLWNTDDDDDYCSTANLDTKQRNHEDGGRDKGGAEAFIPFKMNLGLAVRKEEKEAIPVHGLTLLTPSIKNPKEESCSTGSRTSCSRPVSCSASNARSNFRSGPPPPALSKHLQQQQAGRKQRRCWSPELHRRFVNALQQLGGSQVATPKQIRELMHVDGLTNDEVKSHLQKYRLHTRRPLATTTKTATNQSVVGLGNSQPRMSGDQYGESSKGMSFQSGSPLGPLQLATNTGGTSTTGGDSMEEDEDTKSECYSWKRPCLQTRENRCIESLPTMNFADKEI